MAGAAPTRAAAGEFPLCMYGITGPQDLEPVKKAGFNCFQTYAQEPEQLAELAREAGERGLKMLAAPDKVIGSAYGEAAKSWPMLAWYLYDEPEVRRLPPAELEKLDLRVKRWDAAQRTAFVMGNGMAAFTYGASADALMVDWYPVAHLKPESVGYQVTLVKEAAKNTDQLRPFKPVWAVLQAFNWLEFPQLAKPPVGRFPTFKEIRFMTYLAIARGAGGIFYFQFHQKDGRPLTDKKSRWAMFERLAGELNTLRPALEAGAQLPPPPGIGEELSATVFTGGGRTFMLLLNASEKPAQLDTAALKGWRPLFEEKKDLGELLPGRTRQYMEPYRALVLEKHGGFLFF